MDIPLHPLAHMPSTRLRGYLEAVLQMHGQHISRTLLLSPCQKSSTTKHHKTRRTSNYHWHLEFQSDVSRDLATTRTVRIDVASNVVNAADSDLTLQSSDGVLYKVHRKNLVLHSETFAAADAISAATGAVDNSEIVSLSENSATLDLLLQFMYRQRQPDLAIVAFEILSELAEAAEKYEVYSAMAMCHVHMRYVCYLDLSRR